MNDRQNAKLNMAQRVSETFKRYESTYKEVPAMVSAVEALNKDIKNIRDLQTEQEAVNVSASTLEKRAAEQQMVDVFAKTANALYVIGFTTENQDLITLQNTSEYSFYRLTHNAVLAHAKRIFELANKYKEKLNDYGIKDEDFKKMEQAMNDFNALIAKPMDTIGERKQKTTNLMQLFASLDSIFYDKLDKLMVLFKQSRPDFYDEYRTARNIIFPNEGKSKKVETAVTQ